jgi:hypothetical protein
MKSMTWFSFLGLCLAACLLQPAANAKIINDENACTWGISNDDLTIPADSIITQASLTLYNVRLTGTAPQALYVQLLDNPAEGIEEITDGRSDNFFEGFGTFLKKIEAAELSKTSQDITFSLNEINDVKAWVWEVYDAPVAVTFADATTLQLNSSLLALLDYAGTGASFGFGLDCDGLSVDGISLDLVIRSTTEMTPETRLSFQTGIVNNAPKLAFIPNQTVTAKKPLAFTVSASDIDDDPVTIAASNLPNGAAFTHNTFTWTPSGLQAGIYYVTFTADDGNGGTDSAVVKITVNAPVTLEWTELAYDDFESGWGNYTDGGKDCLLYTRTKYAPQGNNAANIQSGNGDESSFYLTHGIDVKTPGYSEISISFSYIPVSMDNSTEGFRLDLWDGGKWVTLKSWYAYTDFMNFNLYNETVSVSSSTVAFSTNMKIRFVCEATDHLDDVMIDEISISAR